MKEDPAAELVDALAGAGEAVADGHFTLDGEAARAKLRERQLEDPHVYVLLLVEAACLLGGSEGAIAFELGSTSVARFAGISLDADALADPFAAVFAPVPERPRPAQRRWSATAARRTLGSRRG